MVSAPTPHFARAAALMLASTTFFGLMAVLIRIVSSSLPTVEIAFFRNTLGLLVLLPILLRSGASLRTRQLPKYLLRGSIGIASMLAGFWAIGHLPLSQAISLSYSTPLFVTIAAVVWLGERVRSRRWAAVIVGFIGVLVIVQPGSSGFTSASLVAVLASVLSAVVAIQIKQLSYVDPPDTIVFYTYVFWVPLSFFPAMYAWQWPEGMTWLWLGCIGLCGTGGQLLWARALSIGEVSALTPISFMQLPLVSVAGYLLFDESISRGTIIGAAIIFAANAYIAHREVLLSRTASTSAPTEAAVPGE
jgi:drug/metabolite transporter (DMT)-like permease